MYHSNDPIDWQNMVLLFALVDAGNGTTITQPIYEVQFTTHGPQ